MTKVIVGTYHQVEATPVGPWGIMMAVAKGFYQSAKLMFIVFMVGGAVGILDIRSKNRRRKRHKKEI